MLGHVGSGKSFWADKISKKLKITHYDMDDVRFVKKFSKARTKPQRKVLVDKILKKKQWIIDARGTDWDMYAMLKADVVIWMRTPFYIRGFRVFKRYFQRRKNPEFDEKFIHTFTLIRYSWTFRFGKKCSCFNPLKRYMEDNKIKPVNIRNKKQIRKFVEQLKD